MTPYLEYFAVISGVIYLILISRVLRWGWIFGILSSAVYTFICFDKSLYIQSVLQLIYVCTGIWGFLSWSTADDGGEKETYQLSKGQNVLIFTITLLFSVIAYYVMSFTDQKSALLDSFVSVFSLLATGLVVLRIIENWYYWWVINAMAMVLFYQQNLKTTVMLYGIYLILSVYGFVQWRKKIARN
ncbi:nicotinamide riboside transporter PnuC [Crocinitomicaceae bacterium]|nr:nicotinamide riboside transporter PnuC [Crocinitomicaceae bacterium]